MAGESQTLWTIVNRNHYTSQGGNCWFLIGEGSLLRFVARVELHPHRKGSSPCFHLKLKMTAMARFLKLQRPMPHSTSC